MSHARDLYWHYGDVGGAVDAWQRASVANGDDDADGVVDRLTHVDAILGARGDRPFW